jgi:hypothetical protein
MEPNLSARQMSRGEKETETEATRLVELIEDALAVVSVRTTAEVDSLEAIADRVERAARDFSAALRELADQRRIAQDGAE